MTEGKATPLSPKTDGGIGKMPPLDNPQHERFARLIYQGKTNAEAYEMAGYSRHDGNASRLRNNDNVKERLNELAQEAAKVATLDRTYVIQGLMQVVEQSLTKRELKDKKGNPSGIFVYDSAGATKALELLGKTEGLSLFITKTETRTIKDISDLTEEEILSIAAGIKARQKLEGDGGPDLKVVK